MLTSYSDKRSKPPQRLLAEANSLTSPTPAPTPTSVLRVNGTYNNWINDVVICTNNWAQEFCTPLFNQYRPRLTQNICEWGGAPGYILNLIYDMLDNLFYVAGANAAQQAFDQVLSDTRTVFLVQNLCTFMFTGACTPANSCSTYVCDANTTAAIDTAIIALTKCGAISVNPTPAQTTLNPTSHPTPYAQSPQGIYIAQLAQLNAVAYGLYGTIGVFGVFLLLLCIHRCLCKQERDASAARRSLRHTFG